MGKGFVLTGVVFLILIVSVIATNHLLASSRHYGDAVSRDMDIDSLYNTIDDINNVFAFDKDNTFSDGLSDVAYSVSVGPPTKDTKTVCNIIKQGTGKNGIRDTLWDPPTDGYIQQTTAAIESLTGVAISDMVDNHGNDKWHEYIAYSDTTKSCKFQILLNITYTVKFAGIERTITLVSTKNMTLKDVTSGTNTGTSINITDETGRNDFYYSPY